MASSFQKWKDFVVAKVQAAGLSCNSLSETKIAFSEFMVKLITYKTSRSSSPKTTFQERKQLFHVFTCSTLDELALFIQIKEFHKLVLDGIFDQSTTIERRTDQYLAVFHISPTVLNELYLSTRFRVRTEQQIGKIILSNYYDKIGSNVTFFIRPSFDPKNMVFNGDFRFQHEFIDDPLRYDQLINETHSRGVSRVFHLAVANDQSFPTNWKSFIDFMFSYKQWLLRTIGNRYATSVIDRQFRVHDMETVCFILDKIQQQEGDEQVRSETLHRFMKMVDTRVLNIDDTASIATFEGVTQEMIQDFITHFADKRSDVAYGKAMVKKLDMDEMELLHSDRDVLAELEFKNLAALYDQVADFENSLQFYASNTHPELPREHIPYMFLHACGVVKRELLHDRVYPVAYDAIQKQVKTNKRGGVFEESPESRQFLNTYVLSAGRQREYALNAYVHYFNIEYGGKRLSAQEMAALPLPFSGELFWRLVMHPPEDVPVLFDAICALLGKAKKPLPSIRNISDLEWFILLLEKIPSTVWPAASPSNNKTRWEMQQLISQKFIVTPGACEYVKLLLANLPLHQNVERDKQSRQVQALQHCLVTISEKQAAISFRELGENTDIWGTSDIRIQLGKEMTDESLPVKQYRENTAKLSELRGFYHLIWNKKEAQNRVKKAAGKLESVLPDEDIQRYVDGRIAHLRTILPKEALFGTAFDEAMIAQEGNVFDESTRAEMEARKMVFMDKYKITTFT